MTDPTARPLSARRARRRRWLLTAVLTAVAMVVVFPPLLVVFLVFQRTFVQGIASTGIK